MKLSIIYVNFNTTGLLLDSLKSLKELGIEHEIIVVDNVSTNFDASTLTKPFPDVQVITNKDNLGFGRANNIGARYAKGEYLWILNTDTLLPNDHHIERILDFLDTNPDYAAALPLLTDQDGNVQPAQVAYFPTPVKVLLNIPIRLLGRLWPGGRTLYGRINKDYRPTQTEDVEVAVAAALVVRKTAFDQVGGFSPEFFMFYEDSDLCRKLWQAGYKIRHLTEAHMIHLWGGSITGHGALARRKQLYNASQDVYFGKWASRPARTLVKVLRWPLWLAYRLQDR